MCVSYLLEIPTVFLRSKRLTLVDTMLVSIIKTSWTNRSNSSNRCYLDASIACKRAPLQDWTETHYLGEYLDIAPGREGICLSPDHACVREAASIETIHNLNALPLHKSLTRMQIFASDQHKCIQTVALGS